MRIKKSLTIIPVTLVGALLFTGCSTVQEGEIKDSNKSTTVTKETSTSESNKESGIQADATAEQKEIHKFMLNYFDEMVNSSLDIAKELNNTDKMIQEAIGSDQLFYDPLAEFPKLSSEQQKAIAKTFNDLNYVSKYHEDNIESESDKAVFSLMNVTYNASFGMIIETGVSDISFSLPTSAIEVSEDGSTAVVNTTKMIINAGDVQMPISELSNMNQIELIKTGKDWKIDSNKMMDDYKVLLEAAGVENEEITEN